MIVVSLNEVMSNMVDDCGWLGSCLCYALVVFIACVVCDRTCAVVCDEVVCLKRDRNNNVYVL